ncbi:MAG: pyridoxal phosphate-dependent aminotransferase [Prevotella sp.]|nr:pyridoxal phosphate-dependent aminotransferase [Prevotella sp.]
MQSFDKIVNRRGTNCYKYDAMPNDDTIALWVADMDFETAPCVQWALMKRVEHGCYGYTRVPETFYQATIDWFARRHGWHGIKREWMLYTSGVVPAVSSIIKAVTEPGDKVLTLTPAYNCFYSSIKNNGCSLEACVLRRIDNRYEVDLDAFEAACADDSVKVFLLCNPHNPTGRVWTQEELHRMGEICKRHGVFVIADEIHCEFVNRNLMRNAIHGGGMNEMHPVYHPFMAVSDAPCAVCLSPSKAFNIAGLQIANIIIKDDSIRRRVDRAININEVCDVNPFGVIALEAAYTDEGEQWLRELNSYIYANYDFASEYIAEHIPQWQTIPLEGTYLMWVRVQEDADELCGRLLRNANVYINSGTMYDHSSIGKQYIRLNLATQRARLEEGLRRISEELKA